MPSSKILSITVLFAFLSASLKSGSCDEVDEVDEPKDCQFAHQTYKHGYEFNMGCTGRCKCENGGLACVPLCDLIVIPSRCRFLKKMSECCMLVHCPEELFRDDCFMDHEHIHLSDNLVPQWSVIVVPKGHPDQACMATLLNRKNIYTAPECKFDNGTATLVDYSQYDIDADLKPNIFEANLTTKGAILRMDDIERTLDVRDINFAFSENCDRKDCVLFIPSFDPVANRTVLLKGYEVEAKKCPLTPDEINAGIRCVELVHLGQQNGCLNLAGSGVSVKSGNIFFLRGYVVDQPKFSMEAKTKCSESPIIKFIKYLDECVYLSNQAQAYFTF